MSKRHERTGDRQVEATVILKCVRVCERERKSRSRWKCTILNGNLVDCLFMRQIVSIHIGISVAHDEKFHQVLSVVSPQSANEKKKSSSSICVCRWWFYASAVRVTLFIGIFCLLLLLLLVVFDVFHFISFLCLVNKSHRFMCAPNWFEENSWMRAFYVLVVCLLFRFDSFCFLTLAGCASPNFCNLIKLNQFTCLWKKNRSFWIKCE